MLNEVINKNVFVLFASISLFICFTSWVTSCKQGNNLSLEEFSCNCLGSSS